MWTIYDLFLRKNLPGIVLYPILAIFLVDFHLTWKRSESILRGDMAKYKHRHGMDILNSWRPVISDYESIQKKGKGDSKSKPVAQAQKKSSDSGERNKNATPPPPPKTTKKSSGWKPPKEIKKDRFTDDNDDGINDRINKKPAVKIKKKEKPPKEKPKPKDTGSKSKNRRK